MIDLDLFTDLDPRSRAPVLDDRCAAQRWLEAFDEGQAHETLTNTSFGKVSAETHQKQLHATDQRVPKKENKMSTKHNTVHYVSPKLTIQALLGPEQLSLKDINEILTKAGYSSSLHESSVSLETTAAPLLITLASEGKLIELETNMGLLGPAKQRVLLKFLNILNQSVPAVGFHIKGGTNNRQSFNPHAAPLQNDIWATITVLADNGDLKEQLPAAIDVLLAGVNEAMRRAKAVGIVAHRRVEERNRNATTNRNLGQDEPPSSL